MKRVWTVLGVLILFVALLSVALSVYPHFSIWRLLSSHGRPCLGVTDQTATILTGADVLTVWPGSPAARANLHRGDSITTFGGYSVRSSADLSNAVAHYAPGQSVYVHYEYGAGLYVYTTTVTLGRWDGPQACTPVGNAG